MGAADDGLPFAELDVFAAAEALEPPLGQAFAGGHTSAAGAAYVPAAGPNSYGSVAAAAAGGGGSTHSLPLPGDDLDLRGLEALLLDANDDVLLLDLGGFGASIDGCLDIAGVGTAAAASTSVAGKGSGGGEAGAAGVASDQQQQQRSADSVDERLEKQRARNRAKQATFRWVYQRTSHVPHFRPDTLACCALCKTHVGAFFLTSGSGSVRRSRAWRSRWRCWLLTWSVSGT